MRLQHLVQAARPLRGLPAIFLSSSLTLLALQAEADEQADTVFARWRGGELTRQTLLARHPGAEEILAQGGDKLRDSILKTVYIEIYHGLALETGLHRDPEVIADLEERRDRRSAALYRGSHQPDPADRISDEAVRAYYEREQASLSIPGEVDLEVLFVRCGIEARERDTCRARMADLEQRVEDGSAFEEVIAEERERSGPANDSFRKVPTSRLAVELREVVKATPAGSFSPVVETPIGLFWARVLRLADPARPPLERVERRIRRILGAEIIERWEQEEKSRLAELFAGEAKPDFGLETLFAAAARAEGLDRDPDVLARENRARRWRLADHAFYRDPGSLPSDEELAAQLSQPQKAERFRQHRLTLAVVGGGETRFEAIGLAAELRRTLSSAADPGSALRRAAGQDHRVRVEEFGPLTLVDLRRRDRTLAEIVEHLDPGAWRGPFAFTAKEAAAARPAFVWLESVRAATVDDVRQDLYRAFRGRLASDLGLYMKTLGRRWDLEVLVGFEGLPPAGKRFETPSAPSLPEPRATEDDPAENVNQNDRRAHQLTAQP